jgi:hypothetical protein
LTITGGSAVDVVQASAPLSPVIAIYMRRMGKKVKGNLPFWSDKRAVDLENLQLGVSFFAFAIGGDFKGFHFM